MSLGNLYFKLRKQNNVDDGYQTQRLQEKRSSISHEHQKSVSDLLYKCAQRNVKSPYLYRPGVKPELLTLL